MKKQMRIMTEKPLNAETPIESFRTWATDNQVFFKRNQGQMMKRPVKLSAWKLSFEGFDKSLGSAGIKFIRGIPLEKTIESTLLAYEMNGQPLPLKHGYPLRALALGWTGANCVKWLHKITVLDQPYEGFFMDRVYRVFQKGADPKSGEVVKDISVKSIIVEPGNGETLPEGIVPIRVAAYAGEAGIQAVDISVDYGPRNGHRGTPVAGDGPLERAKLRKQRHPGACHRRPHRMKQRTDQLTFGSMAHPPVI